MSSSSTHTEVAHRRKDVAVINPPSTPASVKKRHCRRSVFTKCLITSMLTEERPRAITGNAGPSHSAAQSHAIGALLELQKHTCRNTHRRDLMFFSQAKGGARMAMAPWHAMAKASIVAMAAECAASSRPCAWRSATWERPSRNLRRKASILPLAAPPRRERSLCLQNMQWDATAAAQTSLQILCRHELGQRR